MTMTDFRFDHLARSLTQLTSRRTLSRVLAAFPLIAIADLAASEVDAAAKKNKKRKKRKNRCKASQVKCKGRCIRRCKRGQKFNRGSCRCVKPAQPFGWRLERQWTPPVGIGRLATDANGNLFVMQGGLNRYESSIIKYSAAGEQLYRRVIYPPSQALQDPEGFDIDSTGRMYILDRYHALVRKFTPFADPEMTWGQQTGSGHLRNSTGAIAVDNSSNVYVLDVPVLGPFRIVKYNTNGTYLRHWGDSGPESQRFGYSGQLAVAPNSVVHLADASRNQIQQYSSIGTHQGTWGKGYVNLPSELTFSSDGAAWLVDSYSRRGWGPIRRLSYFSTPGARPQLMEPMFVIGKRPRDVNHVATYGNNIVYVSLNNNAIYKWVRR